MQLKEQRKQRLKQQRIEEEKQYKLYEKLIEEYKTNPKDKPKTDENKNIEENPQVIISSKKAQKILEEGGMLDAYKHVLAQLCKNGLPTGDIFEYASYVVKNYEKKWKEKKSQMMKDKIDKYYEEKEKEIKETMGNSGEILVNKSLENREELKFIQTNTDGQTIYIPRKDIDKIRAVNEQLTKETGLTIEEVIYKKMIVRDVNNYIGVYEDNEREHEHIKLKGDYEVDKEYHKDPSMRIVPLAVKNYFVYGVPVEETIRNHTDIFDFCMRLKTNSKSTPYFRHFDSDYNVVNDKLDRTTRYYISNRGGNLYKDFNGKQVGVNIGFSVTLFNKYVKKDMKDYDINYRFYIIEAKKLITSIETKQLSLFDLF